MTKSWFRPIPNLFKSLAWLLAKIATVSAYRPMPNTCSFKMSITVRWFTFCLNFLNSLTPVGLYNSDLVFGDFTLALSIIIIISVCRLLWSWLHEVSVTVFFTIALNYFPTRTVATSLVHSKRDHLNLSTWHSSNSPPCRESKTAWPSPYNLCSKTETL
jgi:hypothetical protein